MDKKVSVIVPVYNVKNYLERCLDSILGQTYTNIEVILIDDGSTDGSNKLCEKYSYLDNRVKVIHKANGGLSSARNVGIKVATGDFIAFVDSDDWISEDAYEYMLDLLLRNQADAVQCGFIKTNNKTEIKEEQEQIVIYNNKDVCQFYMNYSTETGSYSVWKFLYKKKLIKDIFFREGKINEDIDFNYKVLNRCKKLVVSNQIKYFYFQNGNSLSTGGLKFKDYDLYEAAEELFRLTKYEEYGSIRKLAVVKKARTPLSLLCKIAFYGISDCSIDKKKVVMELKKELRKNALILISSPIPISRKILVISFIITYKGTEVLVKIVKKIKRI